MNEFLTNKENAIILKIAKKIQENAELEARAVVGYTELLNIITENAETLTNEPNSGIILSYLNEIILQTREKIADELSHSFSLSTEYEELTGIKKKEG